MGLFDKFKKKEESSIWSNAYKANPQFEEQRALDLIDLMNKAKLGGTYKINGDIDGMTFDVVWEKSEIAKFGIGFYWHGGDDAIYEKYCHNGTILSKYQHDLSTATNEDLMEWLEEHNADDYVVTWVGLFGKKHEKLTDEKRAIKYMNNPKYNIEKF